MLATTTARKHRNDGDVRMILTVALHAKAPARVRNGNSMRSKESGVLSNETSQFFLL